MAAATVIVISGVVHAAVPALPFAPVALAQGVVRTPPGSIVSAVIELFGYWAAPAAVVGTCAGLLAAGAVAGRAIPSLARLTGGSTAVGATLAVSPLWGLVVALYPADPAPPALGRWPFAAATLPMFVAAGIAAGVALRRLERPPRGRALDAPAGGAPENADLGRRYLLASLGLAGAGIVLGVADVRRLLAGSPDPGERLLRVATLVRASPTLPVEGFGVPGLPEEITPTELFYVVDEELVDPDIDPATWRLAVEGLVNEPLRLTYEELKRFTVVERYQTLQCISNRVGGPLISTAKWAGVRLRDIVERAGGLRPGAREVVFRAAGGYSDSLSIDHAMHESTLVALGMNHHVLPRAHGFPARLLSVGTYGMKNPKWLTSIEVVDHPHEGFWERRGWAKTAPVKTFSRIDTPRDRFRLTPGSVVIGGVAFAGDRGVSRVELSTDAGSTWHGARLKPAVSAYAWSLWTYRWTPPSSGSTRVVVRATDGTGGTQAAVIDDPFPDGASGLHSIALSR